jgi:ADP-ribosylglycohydrolase
MSAVVTHAHPEAAAGAIAVAVAAALAVQGIPAPDLISATVGYTPDSEVRSRLRRVAARPFTCEPRGARPGVAWLGKQVPQGQSGHHQYRCGDEGGGEPSAAPSAEHGFAGGEQHENHDGRGGQSVEDG